MTARQIAATFEGMNLPKGPDITVLIAILVALLAATVLIWTYAVSEANAHHPGTRLNDPMTRQYIAMAYSFYGQPQGPAHAVLGHPPEPYDHNGVAWGEQNGTAIWIGTTLWPLTDRASKHYYCGTIFHEVGHNIGLVHVTGKVESPMNVERPWTHPGCWGPYHVLHRHKHRHRKRVRGKVRIRMHYHRHHHLKVGQP